MALDQAKAAHVTASRRASLHQTGDLPLGTRIFTHVDLNQGGRAGLVMSSDWRNAEEGESWYCGWAQAKVAAIRELLETDSRVAGRFPKEMRAERACG
jgi:hypothetical protein